METNKFISIDEFCNYYQVDISFVNSLQEAGLVEPVTIEKVQFIHIDHLEKMERIIRLHYELDINIGGIEAITHLLTRIEDLQNKIIMLENRLRLHDSNDLPSE